jgi:predicted dehydrogenase
MSDLRFAVFGAGFWAPYQIAAWKEVPGARCVAIYNRTTSKAEELAEVLDIPSVYADPEELLNREKLDFLDIITNGGTHCQFVLMAAQHKLPVICQKPMAETLSEAECMVRACREAGVPLLIHENWRWQRQIRAFKKVLESGEIGRIFRARIFLATGYPIFTTEPNLRDLDEYILMDMGVHLLDVARFLFGEADRLYCQTAQVHKDIKGEDVASVMLHMTGGATVTVCVAYAGNYLEHDVFTQTLIFVEGEKGSAELDRHYWVRVTTESGTRCNRYPPTYQPWMKPDYLASHASIAPCNAHLLQALRGEGEAETTGEDNLKTLRLSFAAYESARTGNAVRLNKCSAATK